MKFMADLQTAQIPLKETTHDKIPLDANTLNGVV